jgi:Malectin domain
MNSAVICLLLSLQLAVAYEVLYSINVGDDATRDNNGILYQKDNNTVGKSVKCEKYTMVPYDRMLYRKQRQGNFSYDLPANETGHYTVILKFVECCKPPIKRIFDIYLNNHLVAATVDILREVGHIKMYTLHIYFSICNGKLMHGDVEVGLVNQHVRLEFVSIKDDAALNSLLLVRGDIKNLPVTLLPTNASQILNQFQTCNIEKLSKLGESERTETFAFDKLSPYTILHFYNVTNSTLSINVINNSGAGVN